MSNYGPQFDELTPEARRIFLNQGNAIRERIGRLYSSDFERLLNSISMLLKKIDKGEVDHPEYLAHSSGHLANYTVSLLQNFESVFASGPDHFLQTILPGLLLAEERLSKAVGNYYYKVKDVKDRYVKELQKLAEESIQFYRTSSSNKEKILEIKKEFDGSTAGLKEQVKAAQDAVTEISGVRERAARLASGDARGRSLEALKRRAESKLGTIEDVLAKAVTAEKAQDNSIKQLENSQEQFNEQLARIDQIEAKASSVLALSSQAGLAASYLNESRKLEKRSLIFTYVLYGASLATLAVAAF